MNTVYFPSTFSGMKVTNVLVEVQKRTWEPVYDVCVKMYYIGGLCKV